MQKKLFLILAGAAALLQEKVSAALVVSDGPAVIGAELRYPVLRGSSAGEDPKNISDTVPKGTELRYPDLPGSVNSSYNVPVTNSVLKVQSFLRGSSAYVNSKTTSDPVPDNNSVLKNNSVGLELNVNPKAANKNENNKVSIVPDVFVPFGLGCSQLPTTADNCASVYAGDSWSITPAIGDGKGGTTCAKPIVPTDWYHGPAYFLIFDPEEHKVIPVTNSTLLNANCGQDPSFSPILAVKNSNFGESWLHTYGKVKFGCLADDNAIEVKVIRPTRNPESDCVTWSRTVSVIILIGGVGSRIFCMNSTYQAPNYHIPHSVYGSFLSANEDNGLTATTTMSQAG